MFKSSATLRHRRALRVSMLRRLCFLVSLGLITSVAQAQDSAPIEPQARAEVISSVADAFEHSYHDGERGAVIAEALRSASDRGELSADDVLQLAGELSDVVSEFDGHAHVIWDPDANAEELHHSDAWPDISARSNHGVERIEILPGNVGYLRLRYFAHPSFAGDTLAAALQVLSNADAVILDLTYNTGGEPAAVQFLASYFIGPEPVLLDEVHWRDRGVEQLWSQSHLAGDDFYDIPLFILTSAATGSAAEGFVAAMNRFDRATTIGQTTYGATNLGGYVPCTHGFQAFVTSGRSTLDDAPRDLEGIAPEIAAEAGEERDRAMSAAWSELYERAVDEQIRANLAWALARSAALAADAQPSADARDALIGLYGDRRIYEENGRLFYRRGERAPEAMVMSEEGVFFLEALSHVRLNFIDLQGGRFQRLDVNYPDPHTETQFRETTP